jgi:hypothetical protein
MFYSYQYIEHEANHLHLSICHFMVRLRNGDYRNCQFTNRQHLTHLRSYLQARAEAAPNLRQYLEAFRHAYYALPTDNDKAKVIQVFKDNNDIFRQLDNNPRNTEGFSIDDLHENIRTQTSDLFIYLYESTLKTHLQSHYEGVYEELKNRDCPFCAIEKLEPPHLFRQDYDHTLYKGKYPMSAVNMRNLIPMGVACNRHYKKIKDVLHDTKGVRRKSYNPYNITYQIEVTLNGSSLPTPNNRKGTWQVQFLPDIEEVRTWADTFELEARYISGVLNNDFDDWLEDFIKFLKRLNLNPTTAADVRDYLQDYLSDIGQYNYKSHKFLKYAAFRHILNTADDGYCLDIAFQI